MYVLMCRSSATYTCANTNIIVLGNRYLHTYLVAALERTIPELVKYLVGMFCRGELPVKARAARLLLPVPTVPT